MAQSMKTVPAGRKRELLRLIEQRGQVVVAALVSELGVSADTVRRDLDRLSEDGLVLRTHGGAVRIDRDDRSASPVGSRTTTNREAKRRIARAAIERVEDGQTLLMNGGSTVAAAAGELGSRRDLTIVTNNLLVPPALPPESVRDVYLLGGSVRLESQVTVGPVELPGLDARQRHAITGDVAFIGVGGISERGFSAVNLFEAQMMSELVASAASVVILCDSSKFDTDVLAQVGTLDVADILVTDAQPSSALAAALREAGCEIVVAPG
jgi:DeoR family fructose operon transcriptional repressor